MPKVKKLTKKQRGFVNDYVLNENGTEAALKNYDVKNEHTAAVIASENLTKPEIVEAIETTKKTLKSALEKVVTPEKVAEKINVLLEAKNGENPDYNAVDKGLKHATNIYGIEDGGEKPKGNTYNFIFSKEVQGKVREIEDQIKAKLLGYVETN